LAAFLRFCVSWHGNKNLGLPIYLFVVGELVGAYENRFIPHIEHIKMVFQMLFFKSLWKAFLHASGYQESRYFISAAADDIIDILVNGLLSLVYIHRDYLSTPFPLLPWMHGSEANEHVFGLLHSLIPDFTMLDVLRMIPKVNVQYASWQPARPRTPRLTFSVQLLAIHTLTSMLMAFLYTFCLNSRLILR